MKMGKVDYFVGRDIRISIKGRIILDKKTDFQRVQIIDTKDNRYLLLDGVMQLSRNDEVIYHESLVHPTMISAKKKNNILIIGGGDGGALREVLKYQVGNVTLCELDKEIIEISKKFFPELSSRSFEDERVEIKFQDGRKFLENSKIKYDAIIVDLTDPSGPSRFLFTKEFFKVVKRSLEDGGVFGLNADTPDINGKFPNIFKTASSVFKNCQPYLAYVPSFFVRQGFLICSDSQLNSIKDENKVEELLKINGVNLKYYNPRDIPNLFKLDRGLSELMNKNHKISTDLDPIEIER